MRYYICLLIFLQAATILADTLAIKDFSRSLRIDLLEKIYPVLYRDGKQHNPLNCQIDNDQRLLCYFTQDTVVSMTLEGNSLTPVIKSKKDLTWDAIALEGDLKMPHNSYILQNGLQSWSLSGWVQLGDKPNITSIAQWLLLSDETPLPGSISREVGAIGNTENNFVIGVKTTKTLPSWVSFSKSTDNLVHFIAGTGLAEEKIVLVGDKEFTGDPWILISQSSINESLQLYSSKLQTYTFSQTPAFGWNSWYYYWSHITPEIIESNLQPFKNLSESWGIPDTAPLSYVIDDGWQQQWGDWYEKRNFNIEDLAAKISEANVTPGIWIAPFLLRPYSETATQHPDWLVKDLVYEHGSGNNLVLDTTHPEAIKHLKSVIKDLVAKGYKILKIDFLLAAAKPGKRHLPVTGLEAYHMGLQAIREAAGPTTYLIASGALPIASFPYVNSWRTGPDIAFEFPTTIIGPTWTDVAIQSSNLSARWFFCSVIHCDTDPLLFRGSYNQQQMEAAANMIAMAGGGLHISENLLNVKEETSQTDWPPSFWKQSLGNQPATPIIEYDKLSKKVHEASYLDRVLHINSIRGQERWLLPTNKEVKFNYLGHPQTIGGTKLESRSSKWPN